MIGEELRRLACALQFLTRLPTPAPADWPRDRLARSAKYFPVAGLAVGAVVAGVLLAAQRLWPGGSLPAILAIAAGVLVTGALHEDGLADTADGLGGGGARERRLEIMKDSRLGGYGALALGLVVAIKAAALTAFGSAVTAAAAVVCAHALARAAAVVVMALTPYAADPAASKAPGATRDVRGWEAALALAIGAAPLALLPPLAAAACTLAGALAAAWPALAARRLIGGHTGDVLGAVEQAFETGFLLGAAAVLGPR